jgi:hypothetical protein
MLIAQTQVRRVLCSGGYVMVYKECP